MQFFVDQNISQSPVLRQPKQSPVLCMPKQSPVLHLLILTPQVSVWDYSNLHVTTPASEFKRETTPSTSQLKHETTLVDCTELEMKYSFDMWSRGLLTSDKAILDKWMAEQSFDYLILHIYLLSGIQFVKNAIVVCNQITLFASYLYTWNSTRTVFWLKLSTNYVKKWCYRVFSVSWYPW